jgi:hypothetical protein
MAWRAALGTAIRDLRTQERRLQRELALVRAKILRLSSLGASGARGAVTRVRGMKANRLSAKGRAAIARAARKRWAKYRAQKRAGAQARAARKPEPR